MANITYVFSKQSIDLGPRHAICLLSWSPITNNQLSTHWIWSPFHGLSTTNLPTHNYASRYPPPGNLAHAAYPFDVIWNRPLGRLRDPGSFFIACTGQNEGLDKEGQIPLRLSCQRHAVVLLHNLSLMCVAFCAKFLLLLWTQVGSCDAWMVHGLCQCQEAFYFRHLGWCFS